MPRGRPLKALEVSKGAREELESLVRSRSLPAGLVRRAETDGLDNREGPYQPRRQCFRSATTNAGRESRGPSKMTKSRLELPRTSHLDSVQHPTSPAGTSSSPPIRRREGPRIVGLYLNPPDNACCQALERTHGYVEGVTHPLPPWTLHRPVQAAASPGVSELSSTSTPRVGVDVHLVVDNCMPRSSAGSPPGHATISISLPPTPPGSTRSRSGSTSSPRKPSAAAPSPRSPSSRRSFQDTSRRGRRFPS